MYELFSRLRAATLQAHQQIGDALALDRPDLSRADYVRLLERFAGFVLPWEVRAAEHLGDDWRDFLAPRMKSVLLAADLGWLTGNRDHVAGLPRCQALPTFESTSQVFGSIYVLEGATLGGKRLAPSLAERFGLSERRGYAYFDPYQEHTGRMWLAFQARVVGAVPAHEYDVVVAAALDTFSRLADWLDPHAVRHADA